MKKRSKIGCLLIICLMFLLSGIPQIARAQLDNRYNLANRLFQRGKYEQALPLFSQLHNDNPGSYLFFEKTAECLINLKRYEEAIEFTNGIVSNDTFFGQGSILLGKIYHVKGDTTRAYQIWDSTLDRHTRNFQIYISAARAMTERREFDRAIATYQAARKLFSNSTLLASEMANIYLQAGIYDKAVNEFLELVKQDPERIDYVQQSLLRFRDNFLYDTAILEIDEFLNELPQEHPGHYRLHQLEVWLLMERKLYRRALATARAYEEKTSRPTFSLYGLGARLLSERKFELAEQAFRYYIDNNLMAAKYSSMEELAQVYTEWADYLGDYNLAHADRRNELYRKAYETLNNLASEAPFYRNMNSVLIRQTELALDYLHKVDIAKNYLESLNNRNIDTVTAQQAYVEGRILLYEKDYDRARIAFTRSKKKERIGELAEKTNYYLALTDFFAGEYEFAKIQLNALERQSTSYFANDAVQLRVWIQEGTAADSTGSILEPFARALELFNKGLNQQAIDTLKPVISGEAYHPMADQAILELSRRINPDLSVFVYSAIVNYLDRWGRTSPLRERLMWEKARIADQIIANDLQDELNKKHELASDFNAQNNFKIPILKLPENEQQVQKLYEEILLEYPYGFYASFARDRIQELSNQQT